jgi:hypothetical protein
MCPQETLPVDASPRKACGHPDETTKVARVLEKSQEDGTAGVSTHPLPRLQPGFGSCFLQLTPHRPGCTMSPSEDPRLLVVRPAVGGEW